jgi:GntR family transcriptional regulator
VTTRSPKYHQVMEEIIALIAELEPGSSMPTERELAVTLGTSRTTLRQALSALAADGRIARTQGSGTFVAEPDRVYVHQMTSYSEDLRAQGRVPASVILEVGRVKALPDVSAELEKRGSLYDTLREAYGVAMARAEDIVETGLATPHEAEVLGVDVGAPMLVIRRTAHDASGRAVEYTRSVFRGDRFRFVARSSFDA